MTVTELIAELQAILDKRDGEDLEVRLDVDFISNHSVCSVDGFENFDGGSEDIVILASYTAVQAAIRYEPRLQMPEHPELN